MSNDILHITIDTDWQTSMLADAEAIERGECLGHHLGFASAELFFSKLNPNRMRMTRAMLQQEPMSIKAISRYLGREYRRVFDDVKALGELGLLEQNDNNKWYCPYSDIHIDMHLAAA